MNGLGGKSACKRVKSLVHNTRYFPFEHQVAVATNCVHLASPNPLTDTVAHAASPLGDSCVQGRVYFVKNTSKV